MKHTLKLRMGIMRKVRDAIRNPYAWPGGYQKSVVMNDGGLLCPSCARKEHRGIAHDTLKGWRTGWDAAGVDCMWEGDNYCYQCGAWLSVYGDDPRAAIQAAGGAL